VSVQCYLVRFPYLVVALGDALEDCSVTPLSVPGNRGGASVRPRLDAVVNAAHQGDGSPLGGEGAYMVFSNIDKGSGAESLYRATT
jgi:hypothetical protein